MATLQKAMKRELLVLLIFGCAFAALSVGSYTQESATYDEPKHLTSGYAALRLRDYRLDLESPPLVCLWAALPLMFTPGVTLDTNSVNWLKGDNTEFYREFLYKQNDADHLLYRARFMIVLLGILLGVLLFSWARELYGFNPAVCVLSLYTLEPNLLAHASLVTMDLGVTCFFLGTIYFLWRVTRNFRAGSLLGATACFAAAMLTKFSALALIPITIILLAAYAVQSGQVRRALLIFSTVAAGTYIAIHITYAFCGAPGVGEFFLPESYVAGLHSQLAPREAWPAFLAGNFRPQGWWYYYPVAILAKTPVAVLVLFAGGLIIYIVNRRMLSQDDIFILVPLSLFLGAAMVVKFNIGLRYVLPIYPFILLVAGKACARLLRDARGWLLIALGALLFVEFFQIYPHQLAFFNFLVGGPRGGSRILVDSNLDWGQDLKLLKRWMNDHNVRHINLCYFGIADPAYYGIDCTRLPGHPVVEEFAAPQLPGYVAISVTNLRGVYLSEQDRSFYGPLNRMTLAATAGYSIYIYRVERPWW
jgi:hypothetical protein